MEEFRALPDVVGADFQGRALVCTVAGSVDPLIKAIGRHEVVEVVSHGTDLEELFLAYYRAS